VRRRPGPVGAMADGELLVAIRREIAASPFIGEGHKKITARLRYAASAPAASACGG
jgi:putative transposase